MKRLAIIAVAISVIALSGWQRNIVCGQQQPVAVPQTITIDSPDFVKYIRVIGQVYHLQKLEEELTAKEAEAEKLSKSKSEATQNARYRLWDELRAAAFSTNDDPVAAYAEARKLQAELDAAEKESKAAYGEHDKARQELNEVSSQLKSNWISIVRQRILAEAIAHPQESPYSARVETELRSLEKKFVQEALAKDPSNQELQKAAQTFDNALSELEGKEANHDKLEAAYKKIFDEEPYLNKAESEMYEELKELFAKPEDATTAAQYKKLQATSRRIVELRKAQAAASDLAHEAYEECKAPREAYKTAFHQVVLAAQ